MMWLRNHPILRTLLITLSLLAVVEGASRLILSRIYDRRFDASLVDDHRYGPSSGLKPDSSGRVWGSTFHSDAFGGRSTGQPADTIRNYHLFLGDSVCEGVGVEDSTCAVSKVAKEAGTTRVVNLAHIGHSTFDELNALRAWTDTCTRIKEVTLLYCLNDVYGRSNTSALPAMGRGSIFGKMNAVLQKDFATYKLLKLFILQHSDSYLRYDLQFYHDGDPHFLAAMTDLTTMAGICAERGIAFRVVMLPYRSQVAQRSMEEAPQQMLGAFCAKHHIPFSDALPAFRAAGDPGDLYLFADEIHLSAKGHLVLAERLRNAR